VRRSGAAIRVDDFSGIDVRGVRAGWGVRAAVAVPVVIEGRPWGLLAATSGGGPLPADTEGRLGELADIAAAAVAGVQAWTRLRDLAAEQAALRRVAELVARGAGEEQLFAAVAAEAAALVHEDTTLARLEGERAYRIVAAHGGPAPGGTRIEVPDDDQGLVATILRAGRPARLDDFTSLRGPAYARDDYGIQAAVGVPIVVAGRIWGVLAATTRGRPPAPGVERRLAQFAELVAAAVAGAQARADLQQLADEQRALRSVAELVARGVPPEDVCAAVAAQASGLLQGVAMTLTRFDGPGHLVVVASHGGPAAVGRRIAVQPGTLPDRLRLDARVIRVDDYRLEPDAELAVHFGVRANVSAPIVVAGEVWGMLSATSPEAPLPPGTEHRLQQFAELVGAALANVQARTEVQALAEEQAALRRLAELAAREAPVPQVLDAVAREASWLAGVSFGMVLRFEPDGSTQIEALAGAPENFAVGMRASPAGDGSAWRVWRTGRAARVDDLGSMSGRWPRMAHRFGFSSSAAAPIRIGESLWGALVVVARGGPLPRGMEDHLSNFSELAGTAIAAVQARRDLRALAEEQAALRRVAELVAHGAPLDEVFTAVATETSALLGGVAATLMRYDGDDTGLFVACCNSPVPVGLRVPTDGNTGTGRVRRSGRPVRIDSFEGTSFGQIARELGVGATVAVPVVVEERLWGALGTSSGHEPLPPGTEDRLAPFAELAAAAIANAENKAKLTASRARVVATADETRRRLQRDVHDSAQQRLVHTIINLKLAQRRIADGGDPAALVEEALRNAERASRDLRDVVRGILPSALTRGGLAAGLETLVSDVPLPVRLRVEVPRLSSALETTAYFVIAEALTNVVKHARTGEAEIEVALCGHTLVIDVRDDGNGGADAARGTGLMGMLDRVEAAEGTLTIISPSGAGTTVHVELPVPSA
jgi:signal transduction histidine kinase